MLSIKLNGVGRLLVSVSALTLYQAALIQSALAQDIQPETVIVSATRVTRDGYSAPTPVTVIGADQLQQTAEPNIFTAINQLPSLAGSSSTQTGNGSASGGLGGTSSVNMFGLGTNRTLVLLDGQRVIGASNTGVVDISQFPQGLIQRVDVVSGGASASWGSDAVAGVVNFIIDKNFTGFKADAELGETTYGDDKQGQIQASAGTDFAGDRGHFEVSGEFSTSAGVHGANLRPWYTATKVLQQTIAATPAGRPEYTIAQRVGDIQYAPGGLITSAGTSLSKSIAGITFGAGGQPSNLAFGSPIVGPLMVGGDQTTDIGYGSDLDDAITRGTLYARLSYKLTPTINVYATVNYGETRSAYLSSGGQWKNGTLTIQCDNPFLPASVATACGGAGHSFSLGTTNKDIPIPLIDNGRTMFRYLVGADGSFGLFGSDWTWDAYAEHETSDISNKDPYTTNTPYYNAAIDAVRASNGAIVCRSAVAQALGCVPLNILGTGVASPSAIAWSTGTPFELTYAREEMASFSVNGEPVSDWAGPISLAAGTEYREEAFHQTADAVSTGNAGGNPLLASGGSNWWVGNFHPGQGSFHVIEGFLETVVPLLKDEKFGAADMDLAARATQYSTAGYVTTWKVGATYSPAFLDGLKFRALQSRDVRAPNLADQYAGASVFLQTVVDDFPPAAGQTISLLRPQVGNPALTPEKSQNTEIGVVYQPDWFPQFSTSVDYYRIAVKNAISTISNQQEMDLCFQGNQQLCSLITFDPVTKLPTQLVVQTINLASVVTDGFNIEASYRFDLDALVPEIPGSLTLRSLATHISKFISTSGIPNTIPSETAGATSGSLPEWHWMGTVNYENDRLSASVIGRYIAPGVLNRSWIQCTTGCPLPTVNNPTIDNNQVAGAFYVDIGGSYALTKSDNGSQSELYFKVDNLTNLSPPATASSGTNAMLGAGVNPTLFDVLGRFYHVGMRVKL